MRWHFSGGGSHENKGFLGYYRRYYEFGGLFDYAGGGRQCPGDRFSGGEWER
jgi:hypothetical protein